MKIKMKKKNIIILAASILALCVFSGFSYYFYYGSICERTRHAFDFGSGAMKMKSAIVDVCKNRIIQVLANTSKYTQFEKCSVTDEAGNRVIPEDCVNRAKIAFSELQKDFNVSCNKDECAGIATAWARRTDNADSILDVFRKSGINLKKISQEQEGSISYYSVLYGNNIHDTDENDIIVWDIGGASFQFSTLDEDGKLYTYKGPYGISNFEREIRERYNVLDASYSPYISGKALAHAMLDASKNIGEKLALDKVLGKKLKSDRVMVFAVGGPMSQGFNKQMYVPSNVYKTEIERKAIEFQDKTFDNIRNMYPLLPPEYVKSAQAASILVYGIMNGAGIERMQILDSAMTDYILVADEFYK
jgi:Tfp pilus assembly PilM family ATPase